MRKITIKLEIDGVEMTTTVTENECYETKGD